MASPTVCEMRQELQAFDEPLSGLLASLDAEAEDRAVVSAVMVSPSQAVLRMALKSRVVDPQSRRCDLPDVLRP